MTLYLNHFGLREAPFKITPTVEFFYPGGKRGDVLHALLYAVKVGEGIMMVTGEVGSGKTMMLRTMAERLPGKSDLIYIANPSLSGREILFHICEELDLKATDDRHDTVRRLQNYLIERHAEGRRVVAFIDEAQAMPDESLEEIRLLSNLETSREKLLQIVLFGQPELDDKLARQNMRQLRERITVSFKLEPFTRADVREYVATRLRAAGHESGQLFTDEACNLIHNVSQGLSRRVNVLADKSMLSAYERGARAVSAADVKRAADDVKFTRMQYRSERAKNSSRRFAFGFAAVAALIFAVAVGVNSAQNETQTAVTKLNSGPNTNTNTDSDSNLNPNLNLNSNPNVNSESGLNSDSTSASTSALGLNSDSDSVNAELSLDSTAAVTVEPPPVGVAAPSPQVATVVERIIERVTVVHQRITVERLAGEVESEDPAQTRQRMLAVMRAESGEVLSGESLARELSSVAEEHQDAPQETGLSDATWAAAQARDPGRRPEDVGDNPKWAWMPAGSYLRGRLNATETWLRRRTPPNDHRHTARLLTVGQGRAVFLERFLRHLADFYPLRNLMVYPARLRSGDKFVVTFGVYPSQADARVYISNLPFYFTGGRPFAQSLAESARESEGLW